MFDLNKQLVANSKPAIWCIVRTDCTDIKIQFIEVCFFSEDEATRCLDWLNKNKPLNPGQAWYEIEKSRIGTM